MSPFPDEFLVLCTRRLSGEASAEEQRRLDAYLQEEDCRVFYAELTTRLNMTVLGKTPKIYQPNRVTITS